MSGFIEELETEFAAVLPQWGRHGTYKRAKAGCCCALCDAAARQRHGTVTSYNHDGCRCDKCKAAYSVHWQAKKPRAATHK